MGFCLYIVAFNTWHVIPVIFIYIYFLSTSDRARRSPSKHSVCFGNSISFMNWFGNPVGMVFVWLMRLSILSFWVATSTWCGARLVGYLQKELLHMLSLINIEIYKTKQNDANTKYIIKLMKLNLLIHQISILFSGLYMIN